MYKKNAGDSQENIHKNIQEYFMSKIHELASEYLDFSVEEQQAHALSMYGKYLLSWNERMNLTAVTDPRQIILKHFFDSAILSLKLSAIFPALPSLAPDDDSSTRSSPAASLSAVPVPPHIIDIGTGAGFPGMVIKIMQPHMKMTLVEASAKKISFLEHVACALELDVACLHIRAEDLGRRSDFREKADGVVSRAVADLPVLLEYAIPLLKVGGYFVAAKGQKVFEEIERAGHALEVFGACVEDVCEVNLAPEAKGHVLVVIKKIMPTSCSYPRRAGQPAKKPL
ncbi:MAG: 16S rRNA (guanine(527)-N(7))-methyltransferase RsmG [Peptococcaceae bacterium]|nr:16S rRNA (guanine(527)-N(7))-methyltransferase RsmG [Peptococcaceae bacterium]